MTHMHFDIELFGDGRNHFHFHGHGHFSFDYNEIVLDPSVLFYLTSHKIKKTQIVYYIPDNLIKLINLSKENKEYRGFLNSFLTYFRYSFSRQIDEDDWTVFFENIQQMNIKTISQNSLKTDKQDNYYENYLKIFSDHDFYISMSPEINFLGDCIGKIMEFSRKTGKIILCKTGKLTKLIKNKAATIVIELPKQFDSAVDAKKQLLDRMFNFHGRKAAKYFIGISLGIGGFLNPAFGGVGLLFAIMDP